MSSLWTFSSNKNTKTNNAILIRLKHKYGVSLWETMDINNFVDSKRVDERGNGWVEMDENTHINR